MKALKSYISLIRNNEVRITVGASESTVVGRVIGADDNHLILSGSDHDVLISIPDIITIEARREVEIIAPTDDGR